MKKLLYHIHGWILKEADWYKTVFRLNRDKWKFKRATKMAKARSKAEGRRYYVFQFEEGGKFYVLNNYQARNLSKVKALRRTKHPAFQKNTHFDTRLKYVKYIAG